MTKWLNKMLTPAARKTQWLKLKTNNSLKLKELLQNLMISRRVSTILNNQNHVLPRRNQILGWMLLREESSSKVTELLLGIIIIQGSISLSNPWSLTN